MDRIPAIIRDDLEARAETLKNFFGISAREDLTATPLDRLQLSPEMAHHLGEFNIEWHVIPPASLVRFDDSYLARLYPLRSRDFERPGYEIPSVRQALGDAYGRIQGTIVGVETTAKPIYLPGNTQFYGTRYGLDPTFDPFGPYIDKAGLKSGPRFINSRFAHTPATLRSLGVIVNGDWKSRNLIPAGYQLTVCPPTVFNLVGALFHREWSESALLELSAYYDARSNAIGFAVGSNAPGDFSYVRRIGNEEDLATLGFRVALIPIP
jgi:hypothetical protein